MMIATAVCICKYSEAIAQGIDRFEAYKPVPGAFDGLTQQEIEDLEREKAASQMIDRYMEQEVSRGGGRTMTMEATAYCYTGCRTYTGTWPEEGRTVAVDPKVIPLGSELVINGQGGYMAEDTGGLIKGRRIDIYFNDEQTCWEWGRRDVEVTILD